jgi:hypothetical protein
MRLAPVRPVSQPASRLRLMLKASPPNIALDSMKA